MMDPLANMIRGTLNQDELYADYLRRCEDYTSDIYLHLPTIYRHAASKRAQRTLELGVRWGNSTCALLMAAHDSDGTLYSIDVNKPDVPFRDDERWHFFQCDDTADAAVRWAQRTAPYDVLFIDTSHTLEHTLFELRAYGSLVKPGGVIMCHDTEWQDRGVALALDVYVAETGRSWINIPENNGMGVINV